MVLKAVDQASDPSFALDPGIDGQALRRVYAADGRVQIRPFLTPGQTERLRDHLAARGDWRLVLRAGAAPVTELDPAAMTPGHRQAVEKLAAPGPGKALHYLYERIRLIDPAAGRAAEDSPLGEFARFLSGGPVIELLRMITGEAEIGFAQAQATRYAAGHFLTVHNDKEEEGGRIAAYVFGLTDLWRPDWGGLLLFHDAQGDVVRGLVPRLNALNVFRVPLKHSVSLVAPFAPAPRYSVTGWFRPAPA
jgi:SM-20-related protein